MHLRRFPGLSIRDPAFLQSGGGVVPPPIGTDDANTMLWYKASEHITPGSYIGDKMDTTTNKASVAAPNMNLVAQGGSWGEFFPDATIRPNANMIQYSENIAISRQFSNFTINTATTGTFNAQNAYCRQQIYWCGDEVGVTYVFKIKLRNITGNTNLHFYHLGSATGATTPVTIDGTLQTYTCEFLAPNPLTTSFFVGIQDQNAAGHGQIEITEWQLYRKDEHDSTYFTNVAACPWPLRDGISAWAGGWGLGSGFVSPRNRNHTTQLMTIYALVWLRNRTNSGYFLLNNYPGLYGWILAHNPANGHLNSYAGGAWGPETTEVLPLNQWAIVTAVYNGASSEIRINGRTAETMGSVGVLPATWTELQVLYDSYGGGYARMDMGEVIVRYTADATAVQDQFIAYLASLAGITLPG